MGTDQEFDPLCEGAPGISEAKTREPSRTPSQEKSEKSGTDWLTPSSSSSSAKPRRASSLSRLNSSSLFLRKRRTRGRRLFHTFLMLIKIVQLFIQALFCLFQFSFHIATGLFYSVQLSNGNRFTSQSGSLRRTHSEQRVEDSETTQRALLPPRMARWHEEHE